MVKPLQEPLLEFPTPKATRKLGKHNSVIEQLVAAHPVRPEDAVYPTNIAVVSVTPSTVGHERQQVRLDQLLETLPGQRMAGFVTMALFAGYASLFSLQHVIKVKFGIPDDESQASHNFSFAITSMYLSNLVFRLGHTVLLRSLSPRERALFGLVSMTISMLILAILVVGMNMQSISLLATAYAFGGFAVGTFETNYSVVLAALGHRTKIIGISGIPVGIFLIIVPGFIAVTAGMPVELIYWTVVAMLVIAMMILLHGLNFPEIDWLLSSAADTESGAPEYMCVQEESGEAIIAHERHSWILPVVSVGVVFTVNMLIVSAFSPGVLLYLYDAPQIQLWPGWLTQLVSTGYFFATFSSFGFVADVVSRKRIYAKKPNHHPVRYLALTLLGVSVILAQIPVIAPLGTMLIFFANGSIYAQSCRWIDARAGNKQLVFSNSVFFFMGDCGSVIGALLIPFIRDFMASHNPAF